MDAINRAWSSGLLLMVGLPSRVAFSARDLAWELQALPPADEIIIDAFSILFRVLTRKGDSLIKRHLTSKNHRNGIHKSEWHRWLASQPMYSALAPLLDTPVSKGIWSRRVRNEIDKHAAKKQDVFKYNFVPQNESNPSSKSDIDFFLLRMALRPQNASRHPPLYRQCTLPAHIEHSILRLRSNCWPSGKQYNGPCPLCKKHTNANSTLHVVMCQTPLAESRLCHSRYLAREVIQQVLTTEHVPSVKQVGRLSLGCIPMKASTQTPFEGFQQTKIQAALF
jgi:hypothetical protein